MKGHLGNPQMRPRKPPQNDQYEWGYGVTQRRARRPKKPTPKQTQRASMPSAKQSPLPGTLPDLYVEVPEVLRLDADAGAVGRGFGDQEAFVPIDMVSDAEIIDAFEKAEDEFKTEDFSFESILSLGSLPHVSQEVTYQIPSPNTLSALPSFTTTDLARAIGIPTEPPPSPPKPRFSTVQQLPLSPEKVAFSVPLKSSLVEFRPWRSNAGHGDSFMNIPVSQKDVFGRINAMLAAKPKKPEIRKARLPAKLPATPARQTTLADFKRRKPAAATATEVKPPPTPRLAPVPAEVVFNRMLVCAA